MSLQLTQAIKIPPSEKLFPQVTQIIVVTFGGQSLQLSTECVSLPITKLHDFLCDIDEQ